MNTWRRRRSSGWPRLLVGWLARGLGAAARDASSQRYSLSQAGREGRPGTPPRAVEETRHADDKTHGAQEKRI